MYITYTPSIRLKPDILLLDLRGRKFPSKDALVKLLGELEEEKELAILSMERLMSSQIAEEQSLKKVFDEFNATKEWKLEKKRFK